MTLQIGTDVGSYHILEQIGADNVYLIQIMNKIDLAGVKPRVDYHGDGTVKRIWLSAHSGEGIDLLENFLVDYFRENALSGELCLQPEQARIRAQLYELGVVQTERVDEEGCFHLNINIARRDYLQLVQREGLDVDMLLQSTDHQDET